MLFSLLFTWGAVFSLLAGLVAGLITYREMVHHYRENRNPMRQGLQTGILTFLFFMAITIALAWGLPSLL